MLAARINEPPSDQIIDGLKLISGRRIEDERRRQRLTQRQFAKRTGISVRWLREVEAGNPVVKIDDHLRCADALHMAPTYMFLPLLYRSYACACPVDCAVDNLTDIEERYVAMTNRRMAVRRRLPLQPVPPAR